MEDHRHHNQYPLTQKPSWVRTVTTQLLLCLALYAALNIGTKHTMTASSRVRRPPLDLYFLSVKGGSWPPVLQTQLLQQMAKAVKAYDVKFVVNISELGEDDPLTKNATLDIPFLRIPWYTAMTSQEHVKENFLMKIKIPYGQVIEIFGVDTGAMQLNKTENTQLLWLQRSLASSDSNWLLAIGFDSLISCEEKNGKKPLEVYKPLYNIFIKYGVDAYLSQLSCAGLHYVDEGVAFIGNPGPCDKEHRSSPSPNENVEVKREMSSGFLLHRVSPLQIETHFIESTGEVVFKSTIHQQGRSVM